MKDENDNAPRFRRDAYHGVVSEAAFKGAIVMEEMGQTETEGGGLEETSGLTSGPASEDGKRLLPLVVAATDADSCHNARLTYAIVEPEAREMFDIQADTGRWNIVKNFPIVKD